jgi:hypothetical protein
VEQLLMQDGLRASADNVHDVLGSTFRIDEGSNRVPVQRGFRQGVINIKGEEPRE